ncbi:Fe-S cluster assembly sulfur transfer protein SufU [Propionibacteriaceae bacterium Y2011]|uniref:Fe-S cluster assembly sulfur transfer protein SufU n=1 Tax=Microlunatus sp. Y2014 TaxID=3418488 RepID=UPI003B4A4629
MNVEDLYQDIILDHYRARHNSGLREPYEAEVHHVNPSCGDEITLRVHVDGDGVADVSYEAVGCSISQASTSVMTELVIGHGIGNAMDLRREFTEMMHGQGQVEPDEDRLEDGIAFAGVAKFPARVKCALLGWSALADALSRAGVADVAPDLPDPELNIISTQEGAR